MLEEGSICCSRMGRLSITTVSELFEPVGKKRESGVYISEWSWSSDTPSPVAMTEVSHWVVNSSALPTEHVGRADANVYREP